MVTKGILKSFGFESITDYYQYIVDSQIYGQNMQVTDLINRLNKEQKKIFAKSVEDYSDSLYIIETIRGKIIDSF